MRVLYYYSSLHFTSGSPKVLVAMIDALDRTGIEPLFWARGEGPLVGELERRGVEVLRGPAGPLARRHPVASLGRIRAKVHALRRARVQLLHVNEYSWNLDLVSAAALARIPVLLHVHNPVEIERWNLDRMIAARVVFVSETHLRGTTNLHRIRRKARVLHNPLDVSRYAGGRDIRASLGLAADDVMAAYDYTRKLLYDNRDRVEAVAKALIQYETLDNNDIDRIMKGDRLSKPTMTELLEKEQRGGTVIQPGADNAQPDVQPGLGGGPMPNPA